MEHKDQTGCQTPEGPILCINNCGFFGSAATMNMCSKCHKDMVLKKEQAKLAASSIDNIINGDGSGSGKEPVCVDKMDIVVGKEPVCVDKMDVVVGKEPKVVRIQQTSAPTTNESSEVTPKEGPSRCSTCRKRVGLTGFNCRCGNLFCSTHRYSDKHNCPFDYRTAARDAIAKANPVVKAEKLDKI